MRAHRVMNFFGGIRREWLSAGPVRNVAKMRSGAGEDDVGEKSDDDQGEQRIDVLVRESPIHAADGIGIRPLLRPVWPFAITRSSSASAARMLHLQTTVKRLDVSLKIAVFAGIAQLVEQLICNQQVAGSSPVASSIRQRMERWLSG